MYDKYFTIFQDYVPDPDTPLMNNCDLSGYFLGVHGLSITLGKKLDAYFKIFTLKN